jgi:nucleoside-diphosphate-sugar epimerase
LIVEPNLQEKKHHSDLSKTIRKVMVTGADGFIGNALCKKLMCENYKIKGVVRSKNYNSGFIDGIDTFQLESIGPITDWSEVLIGIECVVHLAARVHIVVNDTHDPLTLFREVNVAGTERLAQAAASANVRRFIFMSSVKVNGEGRSTPYNERDIQQPQDAYSMSKWEAEKILNKIGEQTGMETVIIRSPLVYGPRVKANFLRLLNLAESGIPLPFASVNNRRSLIYIGNLVDAIVTCIKNPKASGQTYFVSDGDDVSTPELLRRMGYALEMPVRLFPFPLFGLKMAGRFSGKVVEIDRLINSLMVDGSKIQRELDWHAPYSMYQGLKETAKWYKERRLSSDF